MPSVPKDNGKFGILLAKIFSPLNKSNTPMLLQKKSNFVSSRKQSKGITLKKWKTKSIQADVGIFTHILAYSDICIEQGVKYVQGRC